MKIRAKWTGILAPVLAATMALSPSLATASTAEVPAAENVSNQINSNQMKELEEFFDTAQIDQEDRAALIDKIENGEKWDSFGGDEPISSEKVVESNSVKTIERFSDGSAAIKTLSGDQRNNIGPRSVQGCTVVSDINATQRQVGCHAQVNLGIISMGFYFDKVTSPGQLGIITNYYGAHNHVIGGGFSNHRLEKFNDQTVRYSADLDLAFEGFPIGWTAWMQVNLGQGNYAYTTNN